MPAARRQEKALTALSVKNITKPGKYHDGGGLGLYLRVEENGSRFWVQRVMVRGKRCELGLGSPPLVSLADARNRATDNKRLARSGGDPLEAKRKARGTLTFLAAVEKYLENKLAEFRNAKHKAQWRSTLDTYAAPVIGPLTVDRIEARDVLRVLQPIWSEKTETASRLRGRIEAVLSWATVAGYRSGDNPARWKGNLSEMLPKPGKLAKGGNQPALALADLPRWWAALSERDGIAARALQFLTLTAARSGEIRGMTWGEVDLDEGLWVVPASRMKMSKEHRVPLSQEAMALLHNVAAPGQSELERPDADALVFPAPRGGVMSDMTISAVMRRMQEAEEKRLAEAGKAAWRKLGKEARGFVDPRSKRPAVPHGLRSSFRDWAAEQGYPRDLAEMALAHDVGTEVERSYRRSDMVARRRNMMEAWARHLVGTVDSVVVRLA